MNKHNCTLRLESGCKFNHEQWIAPWSCVDLQGDSGHMTLSEVLQVNDLLVRLFQWLGEAAAYKFPIQSIDLVISWISLYIVPSPYALYCRLPGYLIIQLSTKGNPTMHDDISIRRHAYYYHTHHDHHASLISSSTTHCLHHWCIKKLTNEDLVTFVKPVTLSMSFSPINQRTWIKSSCFTINHMFHPHWFALRHPLLFKTPLDITSFYDITIEYMQWIHLITKASVQLFSIYFEKILQCRIIAFSEKESKGNKRL